MNTKGYTHRGTLIGHIRTALEDELMGKHVVGMSNIYDPADADLPPALEFGTVSKIKKVIVEECEASDGMAIVTKVVMQPIFSKDTVIVESTPQDIVVTLRPNTQLFFAK
jgi:predicted transcriptional regulator